MNDSEDNYIQNKIKSIKAIEKAKEDKMLHELEALIDIAEASSLSVERLTTELEKGTLQFLMSAATLLAFMTIGWLIILSGYLGKIPLNIDPLILNILMVFFLLVTLLISVRLTGNRVRNKDRIKRELSMEISILQRLISLIEDQSRRLMSASDISPIKMATISIRISRLGISIYTKK